MTNTGWRTCSVLALLLILTGACAPEESASQNPTAEADATTDAETATTEASAKPDPESLDLVERAALFVLPAPSEIADAVQGTEGLDLDRLTDTPLPDYDALDAPRQALATGRVVADLLIAVPTAPTPQLVEYLDNLIDGLRAMGIDEEQISEVESLRTAVAEGAMGREELIDRFDQLRVEVLREGKSQLGDRNMALVATGGWARAVNLVSRQIAETDEIPTRADALKLRLVIDTLIERLGDGAEVRSVVESLQAIRPITADRPSEPTEEELATLIAETDEILALTRTS